MTSHVFTLVLLLSIVCLCISGCSAKKKSSAASVLEAFYRNGQLNLEELSDIQDENVDISSFLYLSDGNFTAYMIERPRLFNSLILFTATASNFKCSACISASELFQKTYSSYLELYDQTDLVVNFNSTTVVADINSNQVSTFTRKKYDDVLYVFVVDIDSSRDAFGLFGVDVVPKAFLLPPSTPASATPAPGSSQEQLMRHRLFAGVDPHELEIGNQELMLEQREFLKLISEHSGLDIHATIKPAYFLVPLTVVAIIMAFASSLQTHSDINVCYNRWACCVLSLVAFGVGISGSIFCFIRRSPWVSTTLAPDSGAVASVRIFAEQDRHQYILEGVIVAMLAIIGSISLFAIHSLMGWVLAEGSSEAAASSAQAVASKGKGPNATGSVLWRTTMGLLIHTMLLLLLSICLVCVLTLYGLYIDKTDWYRIRDALPPELWQFFSGKVLKTSGLVKRLCRLVYVWVFEANVRDLAGLRAFVAHKWNPLVYEYLKRQYLG